MSARARASISASSSASPERNRKEQRAAALSDVYHAFDLDKDGTVGEDEMMMLGESRRKLGQRGGEWTKEMNLELMKKMGAGRMGYVNERGFVRHFDEILPYDPVQFEVTMKEFRRCAAECGRRQQDKRNKFLQDESEAGAGVATGALKQWAESSDVNLLMTAQAKAR